MQENIFTQVVFTRTFKKQKFSPANYLSEYL
jgi:hypothetical protein